MHHASGAHDLGSGPLGYWGPAPKALLVYNRQAADDAGSPALRLSIGIPSMARAMARGFAHRKDRPGDIASDAQASLVARISNGDTSAEDEMVRLFHRRILVMMLSRVRDVETARDLTQEVLMAVMLAMRKGNIRDGGKLAAFIHGTARNTVNSFFRSKPPETVPLCPEHATVESGDLLENLHRTYLLDHLLSRLGSEDRRILVLSLVEGLKPGEIAERLGLSSEVVRARKSRAIKRAVMSLNDLAARPGKSLLAER
jgi:RNA polymerase sigma factor (sigma-70 family)